MSKRKCDIERAKAEEWATQKREGNKGSTLGRLQLGTSGPHNLSQHEIHW
jgi:hypothetical protein